MEPDLSESIRLKLSERRAVRAKLLASASAFEANEAGKLDGNKHANNYFRGAKWTADGTSIIAHSADKSLRTFIIPPDLLHERDKELSLHPYAEILSAEPIRAFTAYPFFDLQNTPTALLLCSVPDHPIRLHSALSGELIASYPFINPTTEAYISPHSLLFTGDGRNFVSGSSNMLAMFDVSRLGQGPSSLFPTAPSRKTRKTNSYMGMKGIVSALCIEQASNVLAAGTFSRHIGLYNAAGQGECLGTFRLDGNEADHRIGGRGITQLIWGPCGRYLYVVERQSRGLMVYDIRKTGQLLSWAEGRKAETPQRLGVDLSQSSDTEGGLEIWAGGIDGKIRLWRNTHCQEGAHPPDLDWLAHNDAVSSTMVHPSGNVVASCSGQRHFEPETHERGMSDESSDDVSCTGTKITDGNNLRIWAI